MTSSGERLGYGRSTAVRARDANGLDMNKIKITNMAPNLQGSMLLKGDVDNPLVFNITSYFDLILNRQDPDKDFT